MSVGLASRWLSRRGVGAGVSFCTAAGKEQTVRVRQRVTRQAVDAYAQLTGEIGSVTEFIILSFIFCQQISHFDIDFSCQ
jgi:hypothetical protein